MALFNLVLIATLVLVLLLQKKGAGKDPAGQEQEARTDLINQNQ